VTVSHSRGTLGPRLLDHGVVIRARLWTGHKAPCQLELDLLFVSALVLVKQFRNMIDSAPGATLQSGCAVGVRGTRSPMSQRPGPASSASASAPAPACSKS
jgi:hypothetical protein